MKTPKVVLPVLVVCLLISACGDGRNGVPDLPVGGTAAVDTSKMIQLPDVEAAGPGLYIRYHFTKKENTSSMDRNPSAEHFKSRVFRLNEDGKIWYGLYAFDGDPQKDVTFKAYYLNLPRDKDDQVLYIQMEYDNRTHQFKEELIMPNGRKVLEEGTFEIVADKAR